MPDHDQCSLAPPNHQVCPMLHHQAPRSSFLGIRPGLLKPGGPPHIESTPNEVFNRDSAKLKIDGNQCSMVEEMTFEDSRQRSSLEREQHVQSFWGANMIYMYKKLKNTGVWVYGNWAVTWNKPTWINFILHSQVSAAQVGISDNTGKVKYFGFRLEFLKTKIRSKSYFWTS